MDLSPEYRRTPERENETPMTAFYRRYLKVLELAEGHKYLREQAFTELMQLELEIIITETKNNAQCTPISQIRIPGAMATLQRLIDEQVQNPALFTWLFCAFETGLTIPKIQPIEDVDLWGQPVRRTIGAGFYTNIPVTRMVISEIEHLSTSGFYGDVWRTLIMGNKNIALLKTSRKTGENDFIVHEFFIGYCLNRLRGKVPNFMYVYGMFRCENPATGNNNRICPDIPYNREWDEYTPSPRDHLIMEYVRPGIPLGSTVSQSDFNRFMGIYLQAVAACAVAYHELGFTHYDLHAGNVLIQETSTLRDHFIPYSFEGITFYIKSKLIVKIIDYGLSHVSGNETIDNVSTGRKLDFGNIRQIGILNREAFSSNVFYDIYMLAGSLLKVLRDGMNLSPMDPIRNSFPNRELLRQVHHIITYFDPFSSVNEDPTSKSFNDTLNTEATDGFAYRLDEHDPLVTETPFSSYLAYLIRQYPHLLGNVIYYGAHPLPTGASILDCNNLQCSTRDDIEAAIRK